MAVRRSRLAGCFVLRRLRAQRPPQQRHPAATAETIDARNTAIFAAAKSSGSKQIACPAMNSDIVNPMPASAPAPSSCRHEYAAGLTAMPAHTASAGTIMKPDGLADDEPEHDRGDQHLPAREHAGRQRDARVASANSGSTR